MVSCELNTRYVPLSVSWPDSHYVCANDANAFLEWHGRAPSLCFYFTLASSFLASLMQYHINSWSRELVPLPLLTYLDTLHNTWLWITVRWSIKKHSEGLWMIFWLLRKIIFLLIVLEVDQWTCEQIGRNKFHVDWMIYRKARVPGFSRRFDRRKWASLN